MAEHQPIYRPSLREAARWGEKAQWRASHAENIRCRDFITESVNQNHDGLRLGGDTAGDAIAEFGYDRVNFVLANTIRLNNFDGRISTENKEWAAGVFMPDDDGYRREFLIDQINPGLVDIVTRQARQAYDQLNLFDSAHCDSVFDFEDVIGHVLVVNPEFLIDEFKTPDTQLFLAQYGNGCRPTAIGRSIFGEYLVNGEKSRFLRHEFLGVLKPELLPEWAIEKMAEPEDITETPPGGMQFHGM